MRGSGSRYLVDQSGIRAIYRARCGSTQPGSAAPEKFQRAERLESTFTGIGFAVGTQQVAPPLPVVCLRRPSVSALAYGTGGANDRFTLRELIFHAKTEKEMTNGHHSRDSTHFRRNKWYWQGGRQQTSPAWNPRFGRRLSNKGARAIRQDRKAIYENHREGVTLSLLLDLLDCIVGAQGVCCRLRESASALRCTSKAISQTAPASRPCTPTRSHSGNITAEARRIAASEVHCL
jgi:hypothetical protein